MAAEKVVTDEVMEFLRNEVFNAYASGDVLSYTAKDGTEYCLEVTQVFGSDDPADNDGFHAFTTVLLDENGDETDQAVFVTRGTGAYPDCYADMDENVCGWPLFMAHKDEVLSWYNDQKDAGNEVSFTGVSLGGALSQMFAGYIHQETGDTLKSVVTFSSPGIEKTVTYEGVIYDFSGTVAETVHHYLDSGDTMMQMGSYYIEGDIYLYGNNYYLDQAGDSGKVVRFKDYFLQPHAQVKYLLSDEYSVLPQAVFITEMDSSEMTGSWSPLSVTVDEVPEGIENTNNAVITIGDNSYVFNKAYAEITLTMAVSNGTVDVNYASKYVSRQKWEEMRSTEEGRQDFLGTAFFWDFTSDVNVGISGSFSQGGNDYAVITLTGKTDQGKEFLYSFSDGCFLETEEVVTGGNWQDIAGAQTYTVKFDELPSASESSEGQSGSSQNKTYSTDVTNEMIEGIQFCAFGEHQIGDVFEYTSQAGLTYRVKYTELYGSDDPAMNDGFHAVGLVLLDVDGVTETDEHFLLFRATSGFPDAIDDFYKDTLGLPLFAAHTQEVLDWYEKYEGEKITFSGASLGSALSQYYAGWLVNDEGKDKLTRLVTFLPPAIVKEATYEDTTYHFITDETVAETVDYYRQDGDIIFGFGQYFQKGTLHLYGGNAQFDQAEGIKLDEYISHAHESGTYLTGGTSALTYLGDFDTDYFAKDANYSDLAVEVDAVPEGLENTNVEAVTCGDQIYLFNTEYADVALTVVSYDMPNYNETLEDFFEDASLYACRNQWETCRGADKQEAIARLMIYDNTSDIEVSTGRGLTLGGKDYVELANTGSSWACNFFYNFTDKEFVAGNGLESASSLGEQGGVIFSVNGDGAAVALAGEVISVEAQAVTGRCCTGFTSEDVTITGNEFTMPDGAVTVTANYATALIRSDVDYNGIADLMIQYTGGDNQIGFWMDGTNTWQGSGASQPGDRELLGNCDMDANGKADQVMVGNVESGAQIGFYKDGDTTADGWTAIGFLSNPDGIKWENAIGNLTGNEKANSIVWHAAELGAVGVWTDGTDSWTGISGYYDGDWTMQGCGDFNGDGKDEILWSYKGAQLYSTNVDGNLTALGQGVSGWEVSAIGDFSNDGQDDVVLFHTETGSVMMFENGTTFRSLGQLDANDWFVCGAGDYNGDQKDDLLVRQSSTGTLGYYASGNMSQWQEIGCGIDSNWTVVA